MSWTRLRRIGVVVVAGVVAVIVVMGALGPSVPPAFVPSGAPLPLPAQGEFPAISLASFEGMVVGQRNLPVVVNVWASWCAPCRTEMPLLQDAAESFAGRVVILGVASKDDPDAARAFIQDLGLSYPNVFDATGEIRVRLGLTAYPTTYIFSSEGELTTRIAGGMSEQRLAALIEDALR